MSAAVHSTALVDSGASLGAGVEIGAFAIVEDDVVIHAGCRILPHAQILRGTRIGEGTIVGRGAILGGEPQSLGFDPATPTYVEIGEHNTIREHVTIHRASGENFATRVGARNFLMVGCHIGHDAVVGDHNVIANAALLAGHVRLGSHTYVGGGAVFHQFLRVGDYCMIQGNGSFSKDIPPFTTAVLFNRLTGLNAIGLRRAGFSAEDRKAIKALYKLLFLNHRNLARGLEAASEREWNPHARRLLDFMRAESSKGVCGHQAPGGPGSPGDEP